MGPERPAALLFRRRSDVRTVLVLSPASALDGADAVRFPVAPAESEAWGAFLASAAPIEREERGDGRILWLASMIEDEPEAQELEAVWLDRTGAPMGEPARADDLVGRWTALRSSIERTSGSAVLFEAQAAGLRCLVSDSVTDEVLITPLAEAMPLSRGAGCWARRVLERRDYERKQTAQAIKDAGFDVSDQVKFLERLYLGEEN